MGKKIGIIGAGIGGLSAGMLFSKKGYEVTIFEKNKTVGGRAQSLDGNSLTLNNYKKILSDYNMAVAFSEPSLEEIFEKKLLRGYNLDLGFHSIEGGTTSDLGVIAKEAGYTKGMLGTRLALVTEDGFDYPIVKFRDKIRFLPNILRLILSHEEKMKELDSVSIADTIEKYGKGKMKLILELLPRVTTTVNDLSKISTGESFRASQSNLKRGVSPVGYPIGGLGAINKSIVKGIEDNHGRIILGTRVEKILVDNKKAVGIKTEDKEYSFDFVLYNGLVQNLFNILDENNFSNDYVNYLKSLKGTGSLCAYYSFNQVKDELMGKSFLFIERNVGVEGKDAVGMIEFITADPGVDISPKNAFLVQSYVICTSKEAKSKNMLVKLRDILDKNLEVLMPGYKNNLNWAVYPTVWHLDGVAKTIENKKAEILTPVENLFLVGDCTKAPGIGVNCAVKSAFILKDLIR